MNGRLPAMPESRVVYLDYAATTPVDPAVAHAMAQCLTVEGTFANPSSVAHAPGRKAAALIETARSQVAALLGAEPEEIVFTSGATESNNLAVLGVARANGDRGRHIVTSRIEHKAVLDPCKRLEREGFEVTYVTPDTSGRIAPDTVRAALRAETVLVSIMHVNNEIGVVQDIARIGAACREHGVPFHTDAAQSVGRVPLTVRESAVDLLSLTAHKIYGPKGIGALYVRGGARPLIEPLTFGGGQERGLRPGTLATHQIVGFGLACELAARERHTENERLTGLRERLWHALESLGGTHLNGAAAERVGHLLNVSFEGVEGESLVTGLSPLALSTGAACNSASGEPSYVLRALGRHSRLAESSLRFSLGRFTTAEDVDFAAEVVRAEVQRLRSAAPTLEAASPRASGAAPARGGAPPKSVEPGGPPNDVLSPQVRQLFETLPGVGTLPEGAGTVLRGEAGGPGEEAWVRFHLLVKGAIVTAARFQALGCPHTLATAAWLTGRLPGRRRGDLVPGEPSDWARTLGVPVEKLGRLLTVEDALRSTLERWSPAADE
jgi:cysteine desulfurase